MPTLRRTETFLCLAVHRGRPRQLCDTDMVWHHERRWALRCGPERASSSTPATRAGLRTRSSVGPRQATSSPCERGPSSICYAMGPCAPRRPFGSMPKRWSKTPPGAAFAWSKRWSSGPVKATTTASDDFVFGSGVLFHGSHLRPRGRTLSAGRSRCNRCRGHSWRGWRQGRHRRRSRRWHGRSCRRSRSARTSGSSPWGSTCLGARRGTAW
jgi:hypothetical protein